MPKFLPVQSDAAGEALGKVYADYQTTFGMPADNVVKTLAPSSAFAEAYYQMFKTLMGDISINDRTRELALLKVARLTGCKYCLHHHTVTGKKAGISDEMIAALDNHAASELFTFSEKELLSWTEGVTQSPGSVDEEIFKQLKNHYTQQQVIELTVLVGFFNMVSRLCQSLEIEVEGQKKAAGH